MYIASAIYNVVDLIRIKVVLASQNYSITFSSVKGTNEPFSEERGFILRYTEKEV